MNNGLTVALLIFQFAVTMLFYPLRVGANGHVSLARDKVDVNLKLLGITAAKVRVRRDEKAFEIYVNGKRMKVRKSSSSKWIVGVSKVCKVDGIKIKGNLLALIGTDDAKNTALICALLKGILQPIIKNLNIYTAIPSDTLEVDGRLKVKITILQIVQIVFAGLRG